MQPQIIPQGAGRNYEWANDHIFVKSAMEMSEGRTTVVEDKLKPGFHLPRHHHKLMTEIFYILDGEVEFRFDDETVIAGAGTTVNIPINTWHEVICAQGGRLITVFSPGGFERYLEEMAGLSATQFADEVFMTALAEKYDTWTRE